MMPENWTPWHKVVELRPDLRANELPLNLFAADLHEVFTQNGAHPAYEQPEKFFGLTYPTASLRKLAGEVCLRLAGKNDKAVRQLQLTYGGGKTHALITLLHLARSPEKLPDLPAVQEFRGAAGGFLPKARVAALCFDKIDVLAGITAKSPRGESRSLKQPWSILAWQIAGQQGLAILNPDNPGQERDVPPFQELLAKLMADAEGEKRPLLILMDELLMYVRVKVSADPDWRNHLLTFFQCLTQAVSQSHDCCLVASLLASDMKYQDGLGKSLQGELQEIFNRQREEAVEPVGREDISELLRRRFFTPQSVSQPEKFRPHVQAAVQGMLAWNSAADQKALEERFQKSYPFHPDLTDIFFSKWTQIRGYQKTRGALRTFALALRDAEAWDDSPVITASVFLNAPDKPNISPAIGELTSVADHADEGTAMWTGILAKELDIARQIQETLPLGHREMELAVMGTFLHSQPSGQEAKLRDLTSLAAPLRPDKINFRKGLEQWAELSFWLDDEFKTGDGGTPSAWRLGKKPNLTQMHARSRESINAERLERELTERVSRDKFFREGAGVYGVAVHLLPDSPADVPNDGNFHFVILPPACVCGNGEISKGAKRFLTEGASPRSPRTFRNALILLAPARDGLEMARNRIADALAWKLVAENLKARGKEAIDAGRESALKSLSEAAEGKAEAAIRQAWSLAMVLNEKGDPQTLKINPDAAQSHFAAIRSEPGARILDKPISAEVLLPGGPYGLWPPGEKSRRLRDIYQAFVKFPHLPRLLRFKNIVDTAANGCEMGIFGLKLTRPDGSCRAWWKSRPDDISLNDPELEIWLPEHLLLPDLEPDLLTPGRLPGLWPQTGDAFITMKDVKNFFNGAHSIATPLGDYEEIFQVPQAGPGAVANALKQAVKNKTLWLCKPPVSLLGEEADDGLLTDDTAFYPPPASITALEILPANLPGWKDNRITLGALKANLASRVNGRILPWLTIENAVNSAIQMHLIHAEDASAWPAANPGQDNIRFIYNAGPVPPPPGGGRKTGKTTWRRGNLDLTELQDLGEAVPRLKKIEMDFNTRIKVAVSLESGEDPANARGFLEALTALLGEADENGT